MIDQDDIIYFDSNATTQVDPEVVEAMLPFLGNYYGNPSSGYRFGKQVALAVETAREQVANLLGAEPGEILFTSCGTESNNTAIQSALELDRDRQHIVTTKVEHSAIIKHCEKLARKGYEITWLKVDREGRLNLDELRKSLRSETAVLSVMWANNETGVVFPIEEIAAIAADKGVIFHTDAVQMIGKQEIRVRDMPVQFLSLAGHKLHCPKGVGALYVSRRVKFSNFMIGGGQENGRRGGTENVASIVGLGKAAELAAKLMAVEEKRVLELRDRFEAEILERIPNVIVNGGGVPRLPNTSNLRFEGVEGEGLLILLDEAGICASSGSACTTGSLSPSHVMTAMGRSAAEARASLRFSFSRFNREEEIGRVVDVVARAVEKLRGMSSARSGGQPVSVATV